MKQILLTFALVLLAACSGKPSFDDPALSERKLDLEQFFDGQFVAYGQFQDRFGKVRQRFRVDMLGEWDGQVLTLTEDFTYASGTTEQRIWTLTKTGDDTWRGSAEGVIGEATGQEAGDRFNWRYTIDLPQPDKGGTMRAEFDDWMWLLSDNRLLNIAYVERFGVRLGTVTIMFEKQ
ncbi:DUF3833 domain-containing protein [Lentibacter sp.]|uniref:DUF3833 domain-containing protein n=1 Tax=Lentibacter sp. TaxID=2024994 RepID=UPI003F6ABCA5